VEPHEDILNYTLEFVQNPDIYFVFKEGYFTEEFFFPIYDYLKRNKYIENLSFEKLMINADRTAIILQVITNVPRAQIKKITFSGYNFCFI